MTKAWKFPIVLSGLVAFASLVLALYCVYGKSAFNQSVGNFSIDVKTSRKEIENSFFEN